MKRMQKQYALKTTNLEKNPPYLNIVLYGKAIYIYILENFIVSKLIKINKCIYSIYKHLIYKYMLCSLIIDLCNKCACMYACMYVYMHVCMYACI